MLSSLEFGSKTLVCYTLKAFKYSTAFGDPFSGITIGTRVIPHIKKRLARWYFAAGLLRREENVLFCAAVFLLEKEKKDHTGNFLAHNNKESEDRLNIKITKEIAPAGKKLWNFGVC